MQKKITNVPSYAEGVVAKATEEKTNYTWGQTPVCSLEDWLRGEDVEDMLDISKRTLQTLRTNGTLLFTRLGGKIYYKRSQIEQILEDGYGKV